MCTANSYVFNFSYNPCPEEIMVIYMVTASNMNMLNEALDSSLPTVLEPRPIQKYPQSILPLLRSQSTTGLENNGVTERQSE
jgi:hypothetical protein